MANNSKIVNETCSICGHFCENVRKLSNHLRNHHKLTLREYSIDVRKLTPPRCPIDGCVNHVDGHHLEWRMFCSLCTKNRSKVASYRQKILKNDSKKFESFRKKCSDVTTEYHKNLDDDSKIQRLKTVSKGIQKYVNSLSREQRIENYGHINKLSPEERADFIENVMKQTGMFRWWREATWEQKTEIITKRMQTSIKNSEKELLFEGRTLQKMHKSLSNIFDIEFFGYFRR